VPCYALYLGIILRSMLLKLEMVAAQWVCSGDVRQAHECVK